MMEVPEEIKKDLETTRFSLEDDYFGDRRKALERVVLWLFPDGPTDRCKILCEEWDLDIFERGE